ncbi:hypothetical protein SRABI111_00714 [Pseudomonas carnis]|nr:hypothetical protein SRABI08_00471 [Pseudomonas carnis]CAH0151324.1 hypothetical protein SRABI111_00714 [Pseudomonas carnis]CAH0211032.1 hypothetical protein SRABI64_01980 [Pseudomonas carnis]CAH0224201.1 hypothetical protein SRABI110_02562 [Pseudomonas carnis]
MADQSVVAFECKLLADQAWAADRWRLCPNQLLKADWDREHVSSPISIIYQCAGCPGHSVSPYVSAVCFLLNCGASICIGVSSAWTKCWTSPASHSASTSDWSCKPARAKIFCRYSDKWSANFATITWTYRLAVGMPLLIFWAGTGAWISVSYWRQAHFPRTRCSTVNRPGV